MATFDGVNTALREIRAILEEAISRSVNKAAVILSSDEALTTESASQLLDAAGYYEDLKAILMRNGLEPASVLIDEAVMAEARAALDRLNVPGNVEAGIQDQTIQAAIDSARTEFLSVADKAVTAQREALVKGLTGQFSRFEIADQLARSLQGTISSALTVLDTNLSALTRSMNASLSVQLDVDVYEYVGPSDKVTRDWCRYVLNHNSPGLPKGHYRLEHIQHIPKDPPGGDEYPGPEPYAPLFHCGGWNCRHLFVGVERLSAR